MTTTPRTRPADRAAHRAPSDDFTWTLAQMRGVLFDFNGTLSDDERLISRLVRAIAAEHLGSTVTDEHYTAELLGLSDREIFAMVAGTDADHPTVTAMVGELDLRYRAVTSRHNPIGPGPRALVARLAALGLPMAVVTGASRSSVLPVLAEAGLDGLLPLVVAIEDVDRGKPDPQGLLVAAARLGLDEPDRIVVFEDSAPGLAAARAAGMRAIAVTGPAGDTAGRFQHADDTVPALDPSLLSMIFGRRR